ncbi:Serine/threonine-protein kinase tel1, partial [Cryomyces antarcticus]
EDIFGSDVDSSAYATYIWKSCQRDVVSEGYILWVARIVGRAYGSHGGIDISIPIPFHDLKRLNIRNEKEALLQSKSAITRHLVELLSSDNRKEVGLAEMTIRSIMSRFTDAGEAAEFEQVLPSTVVFALSLGHPDRAMTALPNKAAGTSTQDHIKQQLVPREPKSLSQWAQGVTTALALSVSDEAIVGTLPKILQEVQGLAENFFPYILHLVLAGESDRQQNLRREASEACRYWFQQSEETAIPHVRLLITSILYLRTQEILHETTKADRNRWLELDYVMTAEAAAMCGMYKAALLFAETHASSTVRNSRRSSVSAVAPKAVPTKLLLDIFRNVDDPDSFYGVQQPPNLESVMDRLDYEVEGFKSLSFRGARLDSQMRRLKHITPMDSRGTVRSLTALNLDSLTHTLLSNTHFRSTGDDAVNSMLYTARKLEQWDIRAPESNKTDVGAIFRAFQSLNNATDILVVRGHVDQGLLAVMQTLRKSKNTGVSLHSSLTALAILVEIDEVVGSNTGSHLQDTWENMQSRQHWMQFGRYEDVRQILSSRETLFSSLSSNKQLQTLIHTGAKEARTIEIEALLASSS